MFDGRVYNVRLSGRYLDFLIFLSAPLCHTLGRQTLRCGLLALSAVSPGSRYHASEVVLLGGIRICCATIVWFLEVGMVITSTGALSNTILLASGTNAADALLVAFVVAAGLLLFSFGVLLSVRLLPVR